MNKLGILLAVLVLSGCATTLPTAPTIIEKLVPFKVEVPVVQPCVSEEVPLPELLIGKLTDADISDPGKVVQYYVADVEQLKGVVLRQKKLLDACKIPPTNEAPASAPVVEPTAAPVVAPPSETTPEVKKVVPPTPEPTEKPAPKITNPLKPSGKTFSPPPAEHP